MASSTNVDKLIRFIRSSGVAVLPWSNCRYNHMAATLSDAVLQAGLNYNAVVKPRVLRLRRNFPRAVTTSQLLDLIDEFGAEHLLEWNHPEKPARLIALANFCYVRSIETEDGLADWLQTSGNVGLLENVRGVGLKTIDYLKMLVGIPAVAVDRHIKMFVQSAGLNSNDYREIREIVEKAADQLEVHRSSLDYAIWVHVSQSGGPFTACHSSGLRVRA